MFTAKVPAEVAAELRELDQRQRQLVIELAQIIDRRATLIGRVTMEPQPSDMRKLLPWPKRLLATTYGLLVIIPAITVI
jgi:hypothetical protein